MESINNILDNLLTFSFNLSNDIETLKLCESTLDYDRSISDKVKNNLNVLLKDTI